jgi:iron complex outermembrane recepter protein
VGPQARRWRQGDRARSVLVVAFVCLALIVSAHAQGQSSPRKYPINIPQQELTPALHALWKQTGVLYGYSPESAAEEATLVGPVQGQFTIDEALSVLLRQTGLTFSWIDSKSVAIVHAPPAPKAAPPPPKVPRATRRPRATTVLEVQTAKEILEEVTTSASRIRKVDVLSAPAVVLGPKAIEHSGATTIMQLLNFIPQQPFLRPDGFRSNGAQYAELRGLEPAMTLVLINGHRAFASAASFSSNAFDLNQIPLSAVERVEVQLDSISVRHGADAIGGIINIVLRDEIEHPSIEAHFGTAAGGGEERQVSISAGLAGDDARAAIVLDYRDVEPLLGVERDLWHNQDYTRFGSIDQRSTLSSPGNVFAVLPGFTLPGGAPFAAIPEHADGAITEPDEFLPFQLNRESLLQYFPIVAGDRRASAVASAQANLTPDLIAAADLMAVDRHVDFSTLPPVVAGALVLPTNPYNHLGQPVLVVGLLNGASPTQASVDATLIRGSGSLRGKLHDGDWELSLLRSEEDAEMRVENRVDDDRLARVLANPDPDRTLNLLGPGPAASSEVLASVLKPPQITDIALDGTQLTGVISGRLFALPAGDVTTVLGAEWRKETLEVDPLLLGAFGREVGAGFAELRVPLVGEQMKIPAVRQLTVTAAGRFDRFTDFGEIFSPQYGVVWSPIRDVAIRGTYARSFRPPSLYELYLPHLSVQQLIADPRRGESYVAMQVTGGTSDLDATRAESYTAGIEFTPEAIKPLTLAATYWHVAMDKRITGLTPTFVLLHESDVAGRVVRAEPTADDLAAGIPGRVLTIDLTRMNFGSLTTSGIDLGASYAFDIAAHHFAADLKGTWIDQYDALDLPGQAPTDRVNVANTFGTIAQWRAIASLDWQRGALGATTYVRYIPSYDDTRDGVHNGRAIPSQTFLDLQFSLDLGQLLEGSALLRGLKFTGGAMNALNQEPHFAEVNGIQGYDTSQGDLKGRFWYLRLGKTF